MKSTLTATNRRFATWGIRLLRTGGAALVVMLAIPAAAQDAPLDSGVMAAGWTVTPSLGYSGSFDDNVFVEGLDADRRNDFQSHINPRLTADFTGRRSQLSATYDGTFVMYQEFDSLNSYDQRGAFSARRQVTKHATLFAHSSFAAVPTTEFVDLVGVPFVRVGVRVFDVRGGLEAALTKRTTVNGSYNVQWVTFNEDPIAGQVLLGGDSHGGAGTLHHQLRRRLALTAAYDLQRATIVTGSTFTVQNASGGAEYQLSETVNLFGMLGISRVEATDETGTKTAPSWRTGISRTLGTAVASATYGRSFIPSYGVNATTQSHEIASQLLWPLGRRVYSGAAVTWRDDQPLLVGEENLKSFWLGASIGYQMRPWMRIEGFYDGSFQNIDRPDGRRHRNRVGFQVTTAKPMRVR